jgi:DNA-binding MarR family transcriptional regulator
VVKIENNDIGRSIHILSRQIKRKVDEAVSKYNVTAVQCSFIEFINRNRKEGNVYAKDIESRFNMRRATVAEILSLMEKNGLIERKSMSEDARLKEITLTKKSTEIINSVETEVKKVEKDLKKDLTEEELQNFMNILEKMSKNLEN